MTVIIIKCQVEECNRKGHYFEDGHTNWIKRSDDDHEHIFVPPEVE